MRGDLHYSSDLLKEGSGSERHNTLGRSESGRKGVEGEGARGHLRPVPGPRSGQASVPNSACRRWALSEGARPQREGFPVGLGSCLYAVAAREAPVGPGSCPEPGTEMGRTGQTEGGARCSAGSSLPSLRAGQSKGETGKQLVPESGDTEPISPTEDFSESRLVWGMVRAVNRVRLCLCASCVERCVWKGPVWNGLLLLFRAP